MYPTNVYTYGNPTTHAIPTPNSPAKALSSHILYHPTASVYSTHQLLSTHTNSPASLNPYQLTSQCSLYSTNSPASVHCILPNHQPVFTVFYQFTSQCSLYSTKSPASVHCILPNHQPVFTVFYQITSQCSLYSTKSPASVHCILPTHQPVFTECLQYPSNDWRLSWKTK